MFSQTSTVRIKSTPPRESAMQELKTCNSLGSDAHQIHRTHIKSIPKSPLPGSHEPGSAKESSNAYLGRSMIAHPSKLLVGGCPQGSLGKLSSPFWQMAGAEFWTLKQDAPLRTQLHPDGCPNRPRVWPQSLGCSENAPQDSYLLTLVTGVPLLTRKGGVLTSSLLMGVLLLNQKGGVPTLSLVTGVLLLNQKGGVLTSNLVTGVPFLNLTIHSAVQGGMARVGSSTLQRQVSLQEWTARHSSPVPRAATWTGPCEASCPAELPAETPRGLPPGARPRLPKSGQSPRGHKPGTRRKANPPPAIPQTASALRCASSRPPHPRPKPSNPGFPQRGPSGPQATMSTSSPTPVTSLHVTSAAAAGSRRSPRAPRRWEIPRTHPPPLRTATRRTPERQLSALCHAYCPRPHPVLIVLV
jgi:hypothetical protein